jgi:ketosteroid isomerase-like protein
LVPLPVVVDTPWKMTEESTTSDLEELTQRLVDAAKVLDFDTSISFYAPDSVLDVSEAFGVFEGRAAIRGFWEDWLGSYDELTLELEEMCDLGHGVSFAVVVMRGRPRGSIGWVQFRYASVGSWVDGLIERSTNYLNVDAARAAAERLAHERG